jgi:hypothetical protein
MTFFEKEITRGNFPAEWSPDARIRYIAKHGKWGLHATFLDFRRNIIGHLLHGRKLLLFDHKLEKFAEEIDYFESGYMAGLLCGGGTIHYVYGDFIFYDEQTWVS